VLGFKMEQFSLVRHVVTASQFWQFLSGREIPSVFTSPYKQHTEASGANFMLDYVWIIGGITR
jgi:hypothetical protein